MLVGRIAHKRNLRQDRRHVSANQNDERRFLHSAVANGRTLGRQPAVQRFLHISGELARLFNFFLQRDFLHQILELVNGFLRNRIFPRRHFQRLRRGGEVQIVRFYATGVGVVARVGVNRNKQVGALLVGDGGAGFERNEGIVLARIDHFGAQPRFQQFAQAAADFEHQILFAQAIGADGPGIVAAMTGIDHDLANLQPQRADQRSLAAGRGLGFAYIQVVVSCPARSHPRRRRRLSAHMARRRRRIVVIVRLDHNLFYRRCGAPILGGCVRRGSQRTRP